MSVRERNDKGKTEKPADIHRKASQS